MLKFGKTRSESKLNAHESLTVQTKQNKIDQHRFLKNRFFVKISHHKCAYHSLIGAFTVRVQTN